MMGAIPERCYYLSAPTVPVGNGVHPNCLWKKKINKKRDTKESKRKQDNEREVFKYTERLGEVEGWRE